MNGSWRRRVPLALLILYQVALAAAWLIVDRTPPYWDEAWYLYHGARQHDALVAGDLSAWWDVWLGLDTSRPPLVPLLLVPLYRVGGIVPDVALCLNLACLVALSVTVYRLGTLAGGEDVGLMAGAIVSAYPLTLTLSHVLLVELTMVALVAASLLALWRSDAFGRRSWSLLAGVLLGLGALTKVFFPVFLVGPLAVTMVDAVLRARRGRRKAWATNAALMVAVGGALAATWYLPNAHSVIRRSLSAAVGEEGALYGPENPLLWRNVLAYLQGLAVHGLSLPGAAALAVGAAGLVVAARKGDANEERITHLQRLRPFLASSVLVGCVLFATIRNQDLKHVSGILPAAGVLSAWGVRALAGRRRAVAAVVVAGACLQSGLLVLPGVAGALRWAHGPAVASDETPAPNECWLGSPRSIADAREWPLRPMLEYALFVADLESLPSGRARVAVLPNAPAFEPYAFALEAYRHAMPADVEVASPDAMAGYDVVLAKTGCQGWPGSLEAIARFQGLLDEPGSGLRRMPRTFLLPDGGVGLVYARAESPLLDGAPQPTVATDCDVGAVGRFLGYDASLVREDEGAAVELVLYWRSDAPSDGDYAVFVHLIDASGEMVAQDDHLLFARTYPTSMWQPGRFLVDARKVPLGAGQQEELTLRLGLYREQVRLPVSGCAGEAAARGDHIEMRLILREE